MAKKSGSRCKCKRGRDGKQHCFKMVSGKHPVGCKKPGKRRGKGKRR